MGDSKPAHNIKSSQIQSSLSMKGMLHGLQHRPELNGQRVEVEVLNTQLHLHPTSISYKFKVFEHLVR